MKGGVYGGLKPDGRKNCEKTFLFSICKLDTIDTLVNLIPTLPSF